MTEAYFTTELGTLYCGDCKEIMKELKEVLGENRPLLIDAIVTDPPYGLEFMGATWDKLTRNLMNPQSEADIERKEAYGDNYSGRCSNLPDLGKTGDYAKEMQAWHYEWAKAAIAIVKPGAHILAFGGCRTQHRLGCAIEDAGWTIRDCAMWLFGVGFPKSLNVSKKIDQLLGAERKIIGEQKHSRKGIAAAEERTAIGAGSFGQEKTSPITIPATPEAKQWDGWGTSLKPAYEPIIMARKPLEGTVAENVLKHGTGAINIDECRIEYKSEDDYQKLSDNRLADRTIREGDVAKGYGMKPEGLKNTEQSPKGRFPSNVILSHHPECVQKGYKTVSANAHYPDMKVTGYGEFGGGKSEYIKEGERVHSEVVENWKCHPDCPIRMLDEQSGVSKSSAVGFKGVGWKHSGNTAEEMTDLKWQQQYTDLGGASRFFYCAKTSTSERNEGCEAVGEKEHSSMSGRRDCDDMSNYKTDNDVTKRFVTKSHNYHPTVKPQELMKYLIKLVAPRNAIVLDPFFGSGSTGLACEELGRRWVGIEISKEYCDIAAARLSKKWKGQRRLDG